jgi:predicted DCC family thiol-disulfide oxidoreductase YuxK
MRDSTMNDGAPIVLFDGICNLCNFAVRFIFRNDPKGRFHFAALQSKIGSSLALQFQIPLNELRTLVLIEQSKCYFRSDAALRISKRLRFPLPLAYLSIIAPKRLRDAAYNFISNHRYVWFGKRESCLVPHPDLLARFVEPYFAEPVKSEETIELASARIISSHAAASKFYPTVKEARVAYRTKRLALTNFNHWDRLSGWRNARFALFDRRGRPSESGVGRLGDFVRIDLPGPNGFDWCRVEELTKEADKTVLALRPSYDPTADPIEPNITAHFFTRDAINIITLERVGRQVIVTVDGMNQVPNIAQEASTPLRAARNRLVAQLAWRGPQQHQWNRFSENLIRIADPLPV